LDHCTKHLILGEVFCESSVRWVVVRDLVGRRKMARYRFLERVVRDRRRLGLEVPRRSWRSVMISRVERLPFLCKEALVRKLRMRELFLDGMIFDGQVGLVKVGRCLRIVRVRNLVGRGLTGVG